MGFLLKRQTCILNWLRGDVKDFSKKPHLNTQARKPSRSMRNKNRRKKQMANSNAKQKGMVN